MHPVGAGASDVGRERQQNEDSFYLDDERQLYIVADGMGGHSAGEVASAMAISIVASEIGRHHAKLAELRGGRTSHTAMASIARQALEKASAAVHAKASSHKKFKGMGCTLTMLLVVESKAVLAHVGDTRLYLYRDGRASQLSTDHTMANEMAMAGLIERDEVPTHQYANVLSRAIGTRATVKVDTLIIDVVPGDRFLICSDGLSAYIEDTEWLAPQLDGEDLEATAEELVSYANSVGGHDNITALVVEIRADDPDVEIVDEMSVDLSHQFLALESVFIFEGMSLALLTRVLSHCQQNVYDEGDVVISEGDRCSQLMVVVDGRFSVSHGGRVDGELTAGEHVGATMLLSPRRARATLTALENSRLLILQREPFWKLIRARPWLGVGLLERLGRRLSIDLDRSIEQRDDGDPRTTTVKPRERM